MRAPVRLLPVISLTLLACGQINVGFTPDPGPSLATLHLNPSQGSVPRGGHLQYEAIGVYSDGSSRSVTNQVAWSTNDSHVASISNTPGERGLVRGEREGSTEVHAILGDTKAMAVVTVQPAVVLKLDLTPDGASAPVGIPLQLKAIATLSDTSTEDVTAQATFAPGNGLIMGNAPGAVIGTQVGTATVQATLGDSTAQANVVVTGATMTQVVLWPNPLSVPQGATSQVQLWAQFSDGSKTEVTAQGSFKSSDASVASFSASQSGLLTGAAQGSATLTGTFNGMSSSGLVAVTQAALVAVEVSPNPIVLAHGTQGKLKATARYSDGSSYDVSQQSLWSATPASVASVNQSGVLSALSAGAATVKVTYGAMSGSGNVQVSNANIVSVDVSPAMATLPAGTTVKLTASGHFDDGTAQDVTFFALWSSANAAVASVLVNPAGEAVVTGHAVGSVQVSATVLGQTGSAQVSVSSAVLTALEVDPATASVPLGSTQTLKAMGLYSDGSVTDVSGLSMWQSSAGSVTVSNASGSEGVVSAVSLGSATVSATFGGFTASSVVTAAPAQLLSIDITASTFSTPLGVPVQLIATGTYTDGWRDITNQVGWNSSDLSVATVSNASGTRGKVTPVTTGTIQLSAVLGNVSAMQSFTVTAAQLTSVYVTPANVSVPKGIALQLALIGNYTDGSQSDLSALASWTSSDGSVAAPAPNGMVATLSVGSATVTAQVPSFAATSSVSVTSAELTTLTIAPSSLTAPAGATRAMSATGWFTDGSSQPMTGQVTWSCDNPNVAAISNASGSQGVLTTLVVGQANVTARFGQLSSAPVAVTVTQVKLMSIEVQPDTSSTALGFSRQFYALGHFNNGSTQSLNGVTWGSSDGAVATISSSGLLSTVAQGQVTVSASLGGLTGSTLHTVSAPTQVGVSLTPSSFMSVMVGFSTQLKAGAEMSDGSVQDVTAMASWSSSDASVDVSATGGITAMSAGMATISASYGGWTGTVDVSVMP